MLVCIESKLSCPLGGRKKTGRELVRALVPETVS
jgi:hypothetical protein